MRRTFHTASLLAALTFFTAPASAQSGWGTAQYTQYDYSHVPTAPPIVTVEGFCTGGQISLVRVESPEPNSRVMRIRDSYYASGTSMDLTLVMTGTCSRVQDVYVGTILLPNQPDPIEGGNDFWEGISRRVVGTESHHRIRIHFSNTGTGTTRDLRIIARDPGQPRTAGYAFTLSKVEAIGEIPELRIAEEAVADAVTIALYEAFGDSGRIQVDNAPDLLNPVYEPCDGVFGRCLDARVEPDGVHVRIHATVSSPVCSPSVRIMGRLQLAIEEDDNPATEAVELAVGSDWVDGPEVDVSMGSWCALIPGLSHLVAYFIEEIADNKVRKAIEDEVAITVPNCDQDCIAQIADLRYEAGAIVAVLVNPLVPRVTLRVPYDTNPLDEPFNYGLERSPEEVIVVIPDGVAMVCLGRTETGAGCDAFGVGAIGAYNWDAPNPPIPDPWPGLAFFPQRREARKGVHAIYRDPNALPHPEVRPGALLVREGSLSTTVPPSALDEPCRITKRVGRHRLAFGPNDIKAPDGNRNGRGDFRVHVLFIPEGFEAGVAGLPQCREAAQQLLTGSEFDLEVAPGPIFYGF